MSNHCYFFYVFNAGIHPIICPRSSDSFGILVQLHPITGGKRTIGNWYSFSKWRDKWGKWREKHSTWNVLPQNSITSCYLHKINVSDAILFNSKGPVKAAFPGSFAAILSFVLTNQNCQFWMLILCIRSDWRIYLLGHVSQHAFFREKLWYLTF